MKYFEVVKKPKIQRAPTLKNWYGSFDVRDISLLNYYKLPERHLFVVDKKEQQLFTDFVTFPFLLISPLVLDVIKMYGDFAITREIILLDGVSGESQMYFLPIFQETDKIQIHYREFQDGLCSNMKDPVSKKTYKLDRNIFWIQDSLTRHTIISLDFAESLLRRNVTGLELKEVILSQKIGEKKK